MARTRDFEALEQRRYKAATLLRQGVWPAEVARRLGVSRQSVSRWAKALAEQGRQGLQRAKRAGRPPTLTAADLKRVVRALKAGPEAQGYATGLWTLPRVAKLIETACGVRFGTTRVWQLLHALGWSCQRPTGRARERDEAAIRRWKRIEWPRLKKRRGRRPHDRLRRRVGVERAAASGADVGAARADASVATGLQLETAVRDRRGDGLDVLFPAVSRHDQEPADRGLSPPPAATTAPEAADHLGWAQGAPEPAGP